MYDGGGIWHRGEPAFWWVTEHEWDNPCYIDPYTYVVVPAGIDGLEFV